MMKKSVWTSDPNDKVPDITAGDRADRTDRTDKTDPGRVRFIETREYLQRVTNARYEVELLEERINYRIDAGMDSINLLEQLEEAKLKLKTVTAEVAEQISKIRDVKLQMVMKKRYIDGMSWSQIAETMDMKERTVQIFHGRALPRMEKSLLNDGLIEMQPYCYDPEEATGDAAGEKNRDV